MTPIVCLTVMTGPHKGERYCFPESMPTTLGRAANCDICFCGHDRDLCISRRHCRLTFLPPELLVEDLGSANGTYVNGHRCELAVNMRVAESKDQVPTPDAAKSGDIITMGGTSFKVDVVACAEWQENPGVKHNCTLPCEKNRE